MKTSIWIIGIALLFSCGNSNYKNEIPNFREQELSFLHLRFGYDKTNNWIKQPGNLLMIHETFKKVGYKNLLSEEEWANNWNWFLDVNKSPKNLIDSLELTYPKFEESPKYYREFWQRRKVEGNEEVVYQVVREIKQIMNKGSEIGANQQLVNDTLLQLISFEYPNRKLNDEEANKQLKYLIKIGLHQSAYNLRSGENRRYLDVNWNWTMDELVSELNESELNQKPWFEDNTK